MSTPAMMIREMNVRFIIALPNLVQSVSRLGAVLSPQELGKLFTGMVNAIRNAVIELDTVSLTSHAGPAPFGLFHVNYRLVLIIRDE